MKVDQNLSPAFESLLRAHRFVPDTSNHNFYHQCRWRRNERIEEADKIFNYDIMVYMSLNEKGRPTHLTLSTNPTITRNTKACMKIIGQNKIVIFFEEAVRAFCTIQRIYRLGSRDTVLKATATQLLNQYAN